MEKQDERKNNGGKREGAGRKPKEETVPFYARVPISICDKVKSTVHEIVEAHKANSFLK